MGSKLEDIHELVPRLRKPVNKTTTYRDAFDIWITFKSNDRHGGQASKTQKRGKSRKTHVGVDFEPNWRLLKESGREWRMKDGRKGGLRCRQDPRTRGERIPKKRRRRSRERKPEMKRRREVEV